MGRFWNLVFSDGSAEKINGNRVIGKSPVLAPGESFTYQSYVILKQNFQFANQSGYLRILDLKNGDTFKATIDPFCLLNYSNYTPLSTSIKI